MNRERCLEAIAIAEAHGWEAEPITCIALATMGAADVHQGRFEEAQHWLDRAERALRPDLEPAEALLIHYARGMQHIGQGELDEALAALRAAERCQAKLAQTAPPDRPDAAAHGAYPTAPRRHGGGPGDAGRVLGGGPRVGRGRTAIAYLHLADGDAQAAVEVLAPVLAGHAPVVLEYSVVHALLLDAIARDLLGEPRAAEADIERALDLAEPDGEYLPVRVDARPRAARAPPAAPHGARRAAVGHPGRARRLGAARA